MNQLTTIINLIVRYYSDSSFRMYCDNLLNPPPELFGDRSPKWRTIRDNFIIAHPKCEVCGTKDELNVHHIVPFHTNPALELDENNLITLCNKNGCHFTFGHLYNWSSCNEDVVKDTKAFREKVISRDLSIKDVF